MEMKCACGKLDVEMHHGKYRCFQCACGTHNSDMYHGEDGCIRFIGCESCGKKHAEDTRCSCQPKPDMPESSGWLTTRK